MRGERRDRLDQLLSGELKASDLSPEALEDLHRLYKRVHVMMRGEAYEAPPFPEPEEKGFAETWFPHSKASWAEDGPLPLGRTQAEEEDAEQTPEMAPEVSESWPGIRHRVFQLVDAMATFDPRDGDGVGNWFDRASERIHTALAPGGDGR